MCVVVMKPRERARLGGTDPWSHPPSPIYNTTKNTKYRYIQYIWYNHKKLHHENRRTP
jgi:hypothetical protein